MLSGLLKKLKYKCLLSFFLVLFVVFGLSLKNASALDIQTLTPVLKMDTPQSVVDYISTASGLQVSPVGYSNTQTPFASTTLDGKALEIVGGQHFAPYKDYSFDSFGVRINFTPNVASSTTGTQLIIYELTDWNLTGTPGTLHLYATSTAFTLIGISDIQTATVTTNTETVYNFNRRITLSQGKHYGFFIQPFYTDQNPYSSTDMISIGYWTFMSSSGTAISDWSMSNLSYFFAISPINNTATTSAYGMVVKNWQYMPYSPATGLYTIADQWSLFPKNVWAFNLYTSSAVSFCADTGATNYGGALPCLYGVDNYNATTTRILSWSYSTTTATTSASYFIATADVPVLKQLIETNPRDGTIVDVYGTTTAGLYSGFGAIIIPSDPATSGITTLTFQLVSGDKSRIFDSRSIYVDLSANTQVGSTGSTGASGSASVCYTSCSVSNVGGCFQNALAFIFCPSQNSLDIFSSLITTIQSKPPVGYFFVVKNNLANLATSSTPQFTITIPKHIKDYLFNPFDLAISGILWFFFAVHFYKRLKIITV